MEREYDLIIVGAGTGGYTAAIRAAQENLRTALIEEREIGGTCLNRGCIPTKALIHSANLYSEILSAGELGIKVLQAGFDLSRIYSRKDDVVAQIREGIELLLRGNSVDIIQGRAQITAPSEVSVGGESVRAKNIILATGAKPVLPPIEGIDLPGVLTSDEILSWDKDLPPRLTIIGGGVIGVELASIFAALGSSVTIIEALERILPGGDREISQNLSMILKKRGIAIYTSSRVDRIEKTASGLKTVFSGKQDGEAESEAVLVAVGRQADTQGLFAEGLSPEQNRGFVVDERFQTSIPGIYAIGDAVSGGIQLAHAAAAQAEAAVAHIVGKEPGICLSAVPSCVYTNPEIASVGITQAEAKERGLAVKTGKYPMSGNGKSIITQQERGFIKLVVDAESDVILGAQLMCDRASDLISELSTAVANSLTVGQLSGVIRPHPSFSEGVTEALESVHDRAVHLSPPRKSK